MSLNYLFLRIGMTDDYAWRTGTLDLSVDHFDFIEEAIKNKNIEEYLICHEQITRDGKEKPHFHILVFTERLNFTNLIKNFVHHFDLSNKSGKHGGKRRYTSKSSTIPQEELEHFMTYLCKDKNVRSTLDEESLQKLIDKSFKKEAHTQLIFRIYAHLDEYFKEVPFPKEENWVTVGNTQYKTGDYSGQVYKTIKKLIIEYHIDNNIKISPTLKSLIINYLRITELINKKTKTSILMSLII